MAEGIAKLLSDLRPLKYDLFVYKFDRLFGEPSFAIGRTVNHHEALILLVSVSYGLLPIGMLAVFGVYLWLKSENDCIQILTTFVLNLFAAVPFYLLFPVCGPAFAFRGFPFTEPRVSPRMLALNAAPNGVPSVHTSTALLILWFLWDWRWGRILGIIFLVLTILATLGSGQHYVFDLICALPYAAIVYFVSHRLVQSKSACAQIVAEDVDSTHVKPDVMQGGF